MTRFSSLFLLLFSLFSFAAEATAPAPYAILHFTAGEKISGVDISTEPIKLKSGSVKIRGVLRANGFLTVYSDRLSPTKLATNQSWNSAGGTAFALNIPVDGVHNPIEFTFVDLAGAIQHFHAEIVVVVPEPPKPLPSEVPKVVPSPKVTAAPKIVAVPKIAPLPKPVPTDDSELGVRASVLTTPENSTSIEAEVFGLYWFKNIASNQLGVSGNYARSVNSVQFKAGNYSPSLWALDAKIKLTPSAWKNERTFGLSTGVRSDTYQFTKVNAGIGAFAGIPLHLWDGLRGTKWLEGEAHYYPLALSSSGSACDAAIRLDWGVFRNGFLQVGLRAYYADFSSDSQRYATVTGTLGIGLNL